MRESHEEHRKSQTSLKMRLRIRDAPGEAPEAKLSAVDLEDLRRTVRVVNVIYVALRAVLIVLCFPENE